MLLINAPYIIIYIKKHNLQKKSEKFHVVLFNPLLKLHKVCILSNNFSKTGTPILLKFCIWPKQVPRKVLVPLAGLVIALFGFYGQNITYCKMSLCPNTISLDHMSEQNVPCPHVQTCPNKLSLAVSQKEDGRRPFFLAIIYKIRE